MNKQEMMEAIKGGARVSHYHFDSEEWMVWVGPWFEFEDGNQCTPEQFWFDRTEDSWDRDWYIINTDNETNLGV